MLKSMFGQLGFVAKHETTKSKSFFFSTHHDLDKSQEEAFTSYSAKLPGSNGR